MNNANQEHSRKFEKNTKFILIDKASHRFKFDNKLRNETPELDVTRIRVDIQDLDMKKVDDLQDHVSIYDNGS